MASEPTSVFFVEKKMSWRGAFGGDWWFVGVLFFIAFISCPSHRHLGAEAAQQQQRHDYYKILGILPTAQGAEIKKAYHKMSLKYHPDKNKEEGAEDTFMLIAEAYEVLSDEEKRRTYDNSGSKDGGPGEESRGSATSSEPVDLHLKYSGGDFTFTFVPPATDKPTKAPDMSVTLDVDLLDLYTGAEFNVTYTRQEVCGHCGGTGAEHKHDIVACPHCHGSGFRCSLAENNNEPMGHFWQRLNTTCTKCDGTGHTINNTCPFCGGHKVVLNQITKLMQVPAGAADTYAVPLNLEGDQYPGLNNGNVIVSLRVESHKLFTRDKNNLQYRANITLFEALLGFEMNITHLDNHTVYVKHDAVSTPGFSKTIPNEGMPVIGGGGTYGDLEVMFDIDFPKKLDEEEKELLSSVLDEDEIKNIENMIFRRNLQEVMALINRPMGHEIRASNGVETFLQANVIDVSSSIPFHGMLTEWSLHAQNPGAISLQIWRKAPADADFPEHSYSLMGQTRLVADKPGPIRLVLPRDQQIMCDQGDLIGWRLETGESVIGFEPFGEGQVRMTKSPLPTPDLGRTEHFPFSIVRTYPVQARVVSLVLLYDQRGCGGERIEVIDESVDFCSLRFLTGEEANDRTQSVLVPGGVRVEFWKDCGANDPEPAFVLENRDHAESRCESLPVGMSHMKMIRN